MTGRVISDKMEKTVVVQVQRTMKHRLYHKTLRRSKNYLAHSEGDAKPGDLVRIEETRPLSRHKRWRVAEILRRGEVAEVAPREIDSEYLSMEREVEAPPAPAPRAEAATAKEADGAEAPGAAVEDTAEAPTDVGAQPAEGDEAEDAPAEEDEQA